MFVVDAGVNRPPENPLASASEGWLLGSAEFAERIKRLMKLPKYRDEVPCRQPAVFRVLLSVVLEETADHLGVDVASFAQNTANGVAEK